MDSCIGTQYYRQQHNLSTQTLVCDTPSSMLKVANFDIWIRRIGHYDSRPPGYRVEATLNRIENERKRKDKKPQYNQQPTK